MNNIKLKNRTTTILYFEYLGIYILFDNYKNGITLIRDFTVDYINYLKTIKTCLIL